MSDQMSELTNQMSHLTLSDLPTDLHRLILSHDEEKMYFKKENEKLKTQVKMLQCLLDEARQEDDSDSESDTSSDEEETEDTVFHGAPITTSTQECWHQGIQ